GVAPASPVLEDADRRAQEPLLPGIILHGVEPFAATEVGDLDVALHPGQDDPQLLRRTPVASLPVSAHRWSSRQSSSYPRRRLFANLGSVPLRLTHYTKYHQQVRFWKQTSAGVPPASAWRRNARAPGMVRRT